MVNVCFKLSQYLKQMLVAIGLLGSNVFTCLLFLQELIVLMFLLLLVACCFYQLIVLLIVVPNL